MNESVQGIKARRGIRNGWFSEDGALWPGQKFSLALEEFSEDKAVLFDKKSEYQSVLVFRSAEYGNVLVLDGIIQMTERDEFAYHEMLAHLPLFAHNNPRDVLIVGGGDGGVLREVCRHDCVERITIVEIDPVVISVSKRFFEQSTGKCFDDPRLEIVHEDAAEFMRNTLSGRYDVIIADTSDPLGPAESLFQPEFYETMHKSLRYGGVVCAQGECMWIHMDLISDVIACCADMFDHTEYATTMVPTYPCGQIGFVLARKGQGGSCRVPKRNPSFLSDLQWYNPEIHKASFVLPQFVRRRLEPLLGGNMNTEEDERCFLTPCSIS